MPVILKSKASKTVVLEFGHLFLGEHDRNAVYVVYASLDPGLLAASY